MPPAAPPPASPGREIRASDGETWSSNRELGQISYSYTLTCLNTNGKTVATDVLTVVTSGGGGGGGALDLTALLALGGLAGLRLRRARRGGGQRRRCAAFKVCSAASAASSAVAPLAVPKPVHGSQPRRPRFASRSPLLPLVMS